MHDAVHDLLANHIVRRLPMPTEMPTAIKIPTDLRPGDYFEDCAFHPCICMGVDVEDDEITGVSLVDGSYPRACSTGHCGLRKLTFVEALHWKFFGPADQAVPAANQWWEDRPDQQWLEGFRL